MKGSSVLLVYALIAVGFYLLILRPQARRKKVLASTQSSLDPGAEVMLTSGIFGTVVSLEDETVHLELASGAVLKVARQAIVKVVEPAPEGYESDWDGTYEDEYDDYDENDESQVEDPDAEVADHEASSGSTAVTPLDEDTTTEDRPGTPDRLQ